MGVAIFAVPAGLIGSGLTDAMDEEKREDELNGFRRRMQKAFRRSANKGLREYLNALPEGGGEAELEHTLAFIRHFVTTEHRRFPHIYKTYTQQMIGG